MDFGASFQNTAWPALVLFLVCLSPTAVHAQASSAITGVVSDPSGLPVVSANVAARNLETGALRRVTTDDRGRYEMVSLPVGGYEIRASKAGFEDSLRTGVRLSLGQEASVDFHLRVGTLSTEIRVRGDSPIVTTTTRDISGLVGEQQVNELPLNGRSYDLLLGLQPGVVNFTSQKTGGAGISNSTTANNFAVSGNRPQQNLFLLNGVEFTGAAENNMQPGGTSGMLLGVDAVREFNVERDSYGAEFGKHPGAQVLIATRSGSNRAHGTAFEFLRNSALDAPNFFDQGSAPPFERHQFGASLGGPLRADKTFLFGNYEGFRQRLRQTSAALVPDQGARSGLLPCQMVTPKPNPCTSSTPPVAVGVAPAVEPLLKLWPVPDPTAPDFGGIAEVFTSPLQTMREDFGTSRLDHLFSQKDALAAIYTVDDGEDFTSTPLDPFSADIVTLREQVLSLEETHVFSPSLLHTARAGFSRAGYFFTGEPTPGTPAASVPGFLLGKPVGAVVVGGSAASNPQASIGLAGSNNGSNLQIARNLYTFEDRVSLTRGRHQLAFGAWLQRFQSNETIALSQFGQATFASLQSFLQGTSSTFLFDPAPTEMNWRSLFGAFYAEDMIRFGPRLLLSLGLRDEFTTGWNEAHGRAANYFFTNGVINSEPHVGSALFALNHARFLPEPRIALAWSPLGPKTVLRSGFGMYRDLQDALGYRADQNAPFNPTYSISSLAVSDLPIDPAAPVPASAKLVPGGVEPDMKTPTLISWSLRVTRQLSPNTAFTVGYIGSHGYHELVGVDANEPMPTICPRSPCPALFPANFPAPLAGSPVPAGTYYLPAGAPRANPALANTWTWFSRGDSSYHALQTELERRFSHGLTFRGVYTFSKTLDDGDSLNQTTASNAPGLVSNPFNLAADKGLATFQVRHSSVVEALYALPFLRSRQPARGLPALPNRLLGGWSVGSILTIQSGFPFTPQLSYNPSNNGDTRNPVRPFRNPLFTGPVILGTPERWFNPSAFLAPPPGSGFYGDLGRDTLAGPGLASWDFSVLKEIPFRENLGLEFRAELFNLLNRANFNTPNLIVFTPSGVSGTAGAITCTSTTSRQVQFGLKLHW